MDHAQVCELRKMRFEQVPVGHTRRNLALQLLQRGLVLARRAYPEMRKNCLSRGAERM